MEDELILSKIEKLKSQAKNGMKKEEKVVSKDIRPDKINYYLDIAKAICKRSTCLRRRFGALIVKDDVIISTGYNGAPRGIPNCIDIGFCQRKKLNVPPGERYELCRSVHAEANSIINAARTGGNTIGGIMFLHGENFDDNSIASMETAEPCKMCKRMIINAGIKEVIIKTEKGYVVLSVDEWIKSENKKITF